MANIRSQFERFLGRVHQRYVLVWTIEATGLGLLGGCAAALLLTLVLVFRGLPTMPLVLASLAAGACTGLLWAMIHRPTKLASAMEADRQLQSHDLLGSALLVARSQDPWARAVLAEADQWCTTHHSAAVLLNRLGVRAWGGIGLATALVLVLALLPIVPTPGIAGQTSVNLAADQAPPQGSHAPYSRRTSVQQEPEDLHPNRMTGAASDDRQNERQAASGAAQRHGSNAAAGDGAGESHSQSGEAKGPTTPQSVDRGSDHSGSGGVATGAGKYIPGAGTPSNTIGGGVAATDNPRGTPPWRSDHWTSDIDHADQALRFGQVPDQYRDMIHGYFDRANAR